MRLTDVGIGAASVWLPPHAETTAAAVDRGALLASEVPATGVSEVPVATAIDAPDMAARAGRLAIESAGLDAADVDLLIHAWINYQGHDFWAPAHYVASQVGAASATSIGVQQMCNGGAAGLLLAATQVVADPSKQVLVTTGDRFTLPGFDRWASDYAVAYGDGATSALVHRYRAGHDPLQLLSLTMATAPEMERMHRGEDAFTDAARTLGVTVDVRRAKRAFLATGGMEQFREVSRVKIREVIDQALTEAGIEGSDPRIKTVLLPRLGPSTLDMTYLPIVEDIFKARAVSLGEQTGHLGAGDFLANLQDLVESPDLHPDELAIVLGGGGGFTWTCAVVRKALISKGELS